jgi:hypothetical protein
MNTERMLLLLVRLKSYRCATAADGADELKKHAIEY